ncbi:MAG: metal-dependent hydrolase [Rhodocyclales bacterium]|nr:metal-dependent hydrolase [Rhodocyclales bacterium]
MDLLTHAVMGASFSAVMASARTQGRESALATRRYAALAGAGAGLLPDIDVLFQSGEDALLVLDYHRHFTHALAFVPVGALVAALLLWPLLRRRLGFGLLYLCCLVAYLPHPLLDACTSYGTHLWLPFSQEKAAWNLIAVVDPTFTLLLAVPLWFYLRRPQSRAVAWGLALGLAYFGASYLQQQRGEAAASALAQSRGHQPGQLSVKPSMANLLLWRSLYVHDGWVQVDAFHIGGTVRHYPGESLPLLDAPATQRLAGGKAERLRDIERFRVFSDGFVVEDSRRPGFVGDARYAMLPTRIAPIWGLEWPDAGASTAFVSRHDFTPAMRGEFFAMLLGRDLPMPLSVAR